MMHADIFRETLEIRNGENVTLLDLKKLHVVFSETDSIHKGHLLIIGDYSVEAGIYIVDQFNNTSGDFDRSALGEAEKYIMYGFGVIDSIDGYEYPEQDIPRVRQALNIITNNL